jgi:tetratricopeptide (TPR) repeat protein
MLLKQLRFDESMRHAVRALELDPVSVATNQNLAVLYHYRRMDDAMVRQYRKVLEIEPKHTFAHFMIAETLAKKGLESEAFRELEYNASGVRESPLGLRALGEINAILGRPKQAEEMIARLIAMRLNGGVSSCYIAGIYAMIGKRDEAFVWLERAYSERDAFLSLLQVYPAFDSLRADSRYAPLLKRLGFRKRTAPDSGRTRASGAASLVIKGQ